MKRLPKRFVPRCGSRSTRRTIQSKSSAFATGTGFGYGLCVSLRADCRRQHCCCTSGRPRRGTHDFTAMRPTTRAIVVSTSK
jgi:hypothetical protein